MNGLRNWSRITSASDLLRGSGSRLRPSRASRRTASVRRQPRLAALEIKEDVGNRPARPVAAGCGAAQRQSRSARRSSIRSSGGKPGSSSHGSTPVRLRPIKSRRRRSEQGDVAPRPAFLRRGTEGLEAAFVDGRAECRPSGSGSKPRLFQVSSIAASVSPDLKR